MQTVSVAALLGEKYSADMMDDELIELLVLEVLELRQKVRDCERNKPTPIGGWQPGVREPTVLRPVEPTDFRPRIV